MTIICMDKKRVIYIVTYWNMKDGLHKKDNSVSLGHVIPFNRYVICLLS